MATFNNSSAVLNTAGITNLTVSALSVSPAAITGTAQSAQTAQILITANSTTGTDAVSTLQLSNANGVSFGMAGAGASATITATNSPAMVISVVGGVNTVNSIVSTLVFTNTSGVSFGLSTAAGVGTITAQNADGLRSYFNYPAGPILGSTWINLNPTLNTGSTNIVQAFNLPYPVSFNVIRVPINASVATTANFGTAGLTGEGYLQNYITAYANLYSLGTGTQSTALRLINTYSAYHYFRWGYAWTGSATNSHTYFVDVLQYGINNTTSFTNWTYRSAVNSLAFRTDSLTGFTGARMLDIVVTNGVSLAEGAYWLAYQVSRTTSTIGAFSNTGGALSNGIWSFSNLVNTQYASGFSPMNVASTAIGVGRGFWTTNVAGSTSSTLQLSNILTNASNVEIPFEMINRQ